MSRIRRHLRQLLPDHHRLFQNRYLRWLAPYLDHPAFWSLNRRKVALAFAIGLFSGLMPGPSQMITAALLALVFRVNLPVAIVTTLYTNLFTYLPLYYLAYEYGKLLLGRSNHGTMTMAPDWSASSPLEWLRQVGDWAVGLGLPLAIGVPMLGLTLGLAGYLCVRAGWRCYIIMAWKKRKGWRGTR
ncbi:DUF2062 domain-containing protein [Pseudogulbenkiania sp. MAI-1]|uniref:DUF2062 domain-containing protein n=1 Tax=Pseudogulbenkiania sp. MAI-1 TaxID=990370 RepID=UPI0004A4E4A9|nr:DUF2062 domain-containing protein [Pseudogulbenkiania sp. MAI-1]